MNEFLPENSDIKYLNTDDGIKLRTGFFPAKGDVKANIVLINGHREFLEKYTNFINDFQERGANVFSMDNRGQGLSSRLLKNRNKSYNPEFNNLVKDIDLLINERVKPHMGKVPLYLVGHSWGAHLSIRYLHDHPGVFDKAFIMSPFSSLGASGPLFTFLAKCLFRIMNLVGFSKEFAPGQSHNAEMINHEEALKVLTHDKESYDRAQSIVDQNPDLFLGGLTYGWLIGAMNSFKLINEDGYLESIKTPIYCVIAEEEKIVHNDASIVIAERLHDAKYHVMEGARHEIYRETEAIRKKLWQLIDKFLNM